VKAGATELLAVVGPTASGKTELGLRFARERHGEIISVDSRQVYRYLNVGTAKPLETHEISYHLIDFLDPDQFFSAAQFVTLATEKVRDIQARGKIPIFVGGTGLYFKALTEGLAPLPLASSELRDRLKKVAAEKGREYLHKNLLTIDPAAAQKIPANNIQRLVRALEVYELTGKSISQWHKDHQKNGLAIKFVGINLSRAELHQRIEARCRMMMDQGMIEETQHVLDQGYAPSCPALSGLGYPRVIAYLNGKLSKDECLRLLIQDTRQYAKRQMTWFRHQVPVQWKKS
jgi:tRNA dimethylallyltransferase